MLRDILNFFKQNKKLYILIFILGSISRLMIILFAKITQYLIDRITSQDLTYNVVWLLLIGLVMMNILDFLTHCFWLNNVFYLQVKFKNLWLRKIYEKMLKMRISFFHKFHTADIITRFSEDTEGYTNIIAGNLMCIIFTIGIVLFVIPVIFYSSFKIGLFLLFPLILMSLLFYFVGELFEKITEEERLAITDMNNEVLELVDAVRVTRAYGNKDILGKKFKKRASSLAKKAIVKHLVFSLYPRLTNITAASFSIIVIYFGSYEVASGNLSLGEVISLQVYYSMSLMELIWYLGDIVSSFKTGKISFKRLEEIMQSSDLMEANSTKQVQEFKSIELKNYAFSYPKLLDKNDDFSLKNINLFIKKGKTLGIVGKTGSGKTSLIKQFLRQYPVGEGGFYLNGENILDYDRASYESYLAYVPQESSIFSRTVKENIVLSKNNVTDEDFKQALINASFISDIDNMAKGENTMVGERGLAISGGQKQRISLARAFLAKAEILIMDDALSAVDANTEKHIIECIKKMRAGQTNIIAAHRLSAIAHADEIIVLDEGKISERGTHEELLEKRAWYYEQYLKQNIQKEVINNENICSPNLSLP